MTTSDFLIIGGGIIGISIARELKKQYPDAKVTLIDKEAKPGEHASGRNSGVLHAGFYYTADSLKARFTRDGNRKLTAYCEEKGLRINKCGKLVVAKNENELDGLKILLERGKVNGVPLEEISQKEAEEIEPRIRTYEKAIYSPLTATVAPLEVLGALVEDAGQEGVDIHWGEGYLEKTSQGIRTDKNEYSVKFVINAAGLYADKIGRDFGFSKNYGILPFKGLYLYSSEPVGAFRTNIYPVPDLNYPFLGVHFTLTVDGAAKIGPTAIPAFWREQYSGLDNFSFNELVDLAIRQAILMVFSNFDFKKLAVEEMKKYYRPHLVSLATQLAKDVKASQYTKWGKAGIRAQLVNLKEKKLEMDFILEGDGQSLHVLNSVSPAFTCSLPFAEHVVAEIRKSLA